MFHIELRIGNQVSYDDRISLQILRIVGRVWNEGSRMLCQWLPLPSTTTRRLVLQNVTLFGAGSIAQVSSYSSISLLIENDWLLFLLSCIAQLTS